MHTIPTEAVLSRREAHEAEACQLIEVPVDPHTLAAAIDDAAPEGLAAVIEVPSLAVNYRTTTVPYFGGTRTVRVISSRRAS